MDIASFKGEISKRPKIELLLLYCCVFLLLFFFLCGYTCYGNGRGNYTADVGYLLGACLWVLIAVRATFINGNISNALFMFVYIIPIITVVIIIAVLRTGIIVFFMITTIKIVIIATIIIDAVLILLLSLLSIHPIFITNIWVCYHFDTLWLQS